MGVESGISDVDLTDVRDAAEYLRKSVPLHEFDSAARWDTRVKASVIKRKRKAIAAGKANQKNLQEFMSRGDIEFPSQVWAVARNIWRTTDRAVIVLQEQVDVLVSWQESLLKEEG